MVTEYMRTYVYERVKSTDLLRLNISVQCSSINAKYSFHGPKWCKRSLPLQKNSKENSKKSKIKILKSSKNSKASYFLTRKMRYGMKITRN